MPKKVLRISTVNNFAPQKINKKNREIQEAFYEFVHNICLQFYENLSIKAQEDEEYKKKNNILFGKNKKDNFMNIILTHFYKADNTILIIIPLS